MSRAERIARTDIVVAEKIPSRVVVIRSLICSFRCENDHVGFNRSHRAIAQPLQQALTTFHKDSADFQIIFLSLGWRFGLCFRSV
jgi:hypothetical protein